MSRHVASCSAELRARGGGRIDRGVRARDRSRVLGCGGRRGLARRNVVCRERPLQLVELREVRGAQSGLARVGGAQQLGGLGKASVEMRALALQLLRARLLRGKCRRRLLDPLLLPARHRHLANGVPLS